MGMGDEILVVKRDVLFKNDNFEGFIDSTKKNFIDLILKNIEYKIRSNELENDNNWQQPIPYVWLLNPETKMVFLYKRSKTGNEGRLYDKISGGVGGHIDKKELVENNIDPITQAMMRELMEETVMEEYPKPKIIGYLNYNSGVEDVHFGIVAIGETTNEVKPAEDMTHGQFYSIDEVEEMFDAKKDQVEKWTLASWPFIKDYLNKL